jgi:hypothetical protein
MDLSYTAAETLYNANLFVFDLGMDYVDLVALAACSTALILPGDGHRIKTHSLCLYRVFQEK